MPAAAAAAAVLLLLAAPLLLASWARAASDVAPPYVWVGAATDTSFTVHVDLQTLPSAAADDSRGAPLLVSTRESLEQQAAFPVKPVDQRFPPPHDGFRVYVTTGLLPGTKYFFGFTPATDTRTQAAPIALGSVTTFPPRVSHADVLVGFGSCQKWTARSDSLQSIAALAANASNSTAVLMLHLGDLHYQDIAKDDITMFKDAVEAVVRDPGASRLFSSMHVSYMYDDHDYASNNGDAFSPSRAAAMTNYRRMVPFNVSFTEQTSPSHNYHAFTVGSVKFIITDLRSEADKTSGTVMNSAQLQWFFQELSEASTYAVVVWASSRPWIGKNSTSKDYWGAFAEQRAQISNYIAERGIHNLLMVAGDAHMLAADDGTNSNYARVGLPPAGFPVLHSAPIANRGSSKGGPFSEGCYSTKLTSNYHYATLRIHSVGTTDGPCISYKGYAKHQSDPVLTFDKCGMLGGVAGTPGGGQRTSCNIRLAPPWMIALGVLAFIYVIAVILRGCILLIRCRKTDANKR